MSKKEFAEKVICQGIEKWIAYADKIGHRLFMPQIDKVHFHVTDAQMAYIKPFLIALGCFGYSYMLKFRVAGYEVKFTKIDHPCDRYTWNVMCTHETYSDDTRLMFIDLLDENPAFEKKVFAKEIRTF